MEDGKLDLRDVYVMDEEAGMYARPEVTGDMPPAPAHYIRVPWREEFLGDIAYAKEPTFQVRHSRRLRGVGDTCDEHCVVEKCIL